MLGSKLLPSMSETLGFNGTVPGRAISLVDNWTSEEQGEAQGEREQNTKYVSINLSETTGWKERNTAQLRESFLSFEPVLSVALQSRHITLISTVATYSHCVWSQDRWKGELFMAAFCSGPPGLTQLQGSRGFPCSLWSPHINTLCLLPVLREPPEPLPAPCRLGCSSCQGRGSLELEGGPGAGTASSDLRADWRSFAHQFPELSLGMQYWAGLVNGICPLCSWPREIKDQGDCCSFIV